MSTDKQTAQHTVRLYNSKCTGALYTLFTSHRLTGHCQGVTKAVGTHLSGRLLLWRGDHLREVKTRANVWAVHWDRKKSGHRKEVALVKVPLYYICIKHCFTYLGCNVEITCLVFSSYTFSFVSDPAVTNLSPEELYAHAKICLEGSVIVPIHELVDMCHIFIFPSASEDSL